MNLTTTCYNCGHESHCGTTLKKDLWSVWDKRLGEIEICKNCICEKCSKKEKEDEQEAISGRTDKR